MIIHYFIGWFSGRCVAVVDAHPSLDASMQIPWSSASLRAWTTGYYTVIIHYVIGRFSGRCVAVVDAHSSLYASM